MKLAVAIVLTAFVVGCRNVPPRDTTTAEASPNPGVDKAGLRKALEYLGTAPCNCGFGQ